MRYVALLIMLLVSGSAWAEEDCSKIDRYYTFGQGPQQQCRIANALENIAEALAK